MGQAPSLTFHPSLGSSYDISIPSTSPAPFDKSQESIQLLLDAHLKTEEAEELRREGTRIQAWTNAPVLDRGEGEWAAWDFEPIESLDISSQGTHPNEEIVRLSLVAPKDGLSEGPSFEDESDGIVHLRLRLPLRSNPFAYGQSETRFAITYRLERRDGNAHWLGEPGKDVSCLLRRKDPWVELERTQPFAEREVDGEGVEVRVLEHLGGESADALELEIGKMVMSEEWGCWAVREGRISYHAQYTRLPSSRVLIFVPRPNDITFALHKSIIVWTSSPNISLSVSATGHVLCSHPSSIFFSPSGTALFERHLEPVLVPLGLRRLEVTEGQNEVVVLVSTNQLFFIRLAIDRTSVSRIRLTPRSILLMATRMHFSDAETPILGCALYTSSLKRAVHVSASSEEVMVELGGAETNMCCVLSPVYGPGGGVTTSMGEDIDQGWALALLGSHELMPKPSVSSLPVLASDVPIASILELEEHPASGSNPPVLVDVPTPPEKDSHPCSHPTRESIISSISSSTAFDPILPTSPMATPPAPLSEHGSESSTSSSSTATAVDPSPPSTRSTSTELFKPDAENTLESTGRRIRSSRPFLWILLLAFKILAFVRGFLMSKILGLGVLPSSILWSRFLHGRPRQDRSTVASRHPQLSIGPRPQRHEESPKAHTVEDKARAKIVEYSKAGEEDYGQRDGYLDHTPHSRTGSLPPIFEDDESEPLSVQETLSNGSPSATEETEPSAPPAVDVIPARVPALTFSLTGHSHSADSKLSLLFLPLLRSSPPSSGSSSGMAKTYEVDLVMDGESVDVDGVEVGVVDGSKALLLEATSEVSVYDGKRLDVYVRQVQAMT